MSTAIAFFLEGINETVPGNLRFTVLNDGLAVIDTFGFLSLQSVGEIQVAALAGPTTSEYNSAPPLVRTITISKRPLKAIAQVQAVYPELLILNFA